MEPRGFDLKRKISRDTMTSVVNRGVFTVFGYDFDRFRGKTPRFTTEVIVSREIFRFKSNPCGSIIS